MSSCLYTAIVWQNCNFDSIPQSLSSYLGRFLNSAKENQATIQINDTKKK